MPSPAAIPSLAIACGGTGGHLFPGLAVGEQLHRRGFQVTLLVSPKDVDQAAVRHVRDLRVATLPAVALAGKNLPGFALGFFRAYRACQRLFQTAPPAAVLAMGGFTSAPPVLAGRRRGARTFLHESNAIPGRANRWLARGVDRAFVGFVEAAPRLRARRVDVTGTPVRPQFQPRPAAECRRALGLAPERPTLLVMGGSQGARGINDLFLTALPQLRADAPELQFIHLTGATDFATVQARHAELQSGALVQPFSDTMEVVMGAATVAVNRAGASSLAELAALRLPAVLIPYPAAADNHQWHNAHAYASTGAARLLEQATATPALLAGQVLALLRDAAGLAEFRTALAAWDRPHAAEAIATAICSALALGTPVAVPSAREGATYPLASQPLRS